MSKRLPIVSVRASWRLPVRQWAFLAACLVVAAFCLPGCMRPVEPPLRIGLNLWPPYELIYLAQETGIFAEEGVSVRLVEFESLSDSRRAFEQGKIDGFAGTLVEVLVAAAETERDPRVVRVINFSEGADKLIARDSIASVPELRGKRIGVELGSVSFYLLKRLLELHSVPLDSVEVLHRSAGVLSTMLRQGQIDAAVLYPPELSPFISDPGYRVLASSADVPGEVVDVCAFGADILRTRADQVRRFGNALLRAQKLLEEDPERALAVMARREGLSPQEFQRTLIDGIRLATPAEQAELLASGGSIEVVAVRIEVLMRENGLLRREVDARRIFQKP